MKKKFLYISIENSNREILPKLLIASEAIKKKFTVILGNRHVLLSILKYLPKGAILEKSSGYQLTKIFEKNYNLGFKIFALDEEALTMPSKKQYMKLNYYKKNEKYLNTFFISNYQQRQMLFSSKVNKQKLYVTGTPKFEIYKKKYRKIFKEETKKIKNKYKKYILITSRFAHINPNMTSLDDIDKLDHTYLSTSKIIFKKLINLTIELSLEFKNIDIIYRPHPSENIKKLKKIFINYNNIKVVYDGNVAPWILGSILIIHNRCTTGLEGLLLDKPVISFDPVSYKGIHTKFFKILGYKCNSSTKVINIIKKVINKKKMIFKYDNKIFNDYVYKFETNFPHKKIVNFIQQKVKDEKNSISSFTKFFLLIIALKKNVVFYVKFFWRRKRISYQHQKFGKLNTKFLQDKMNLIFDNNKEKNKYNFKINYLCRQLFLIKKV